MGGRRPARRAAARRSVDERDLGRQLVVAPRRRPGDPHRRLRDGRAVPLLPPRPAAAGRDQRQERDHRHAPAPTSTSPSKDVVASAFGHAGQKCSAASLVILVGSVAPVARASAASWSTRSRRSRSAYPGTRATPAWARSSSRPQGKLLRAPHHARRGRVLAGRAAAGSTTAGGCWTPGHPRRRAPRLASTTCTEYFGPVLGIMTRRHARRGDRAAVTTIDYGLTAGLHSLDRDEIARWLDARRGRQPLRQPRHHRRDRAAPALRRLEEVGRRAGRQGRRARTTCSALGVVGRSRADRRGATRPAVDAGRGGRARGGRPAGRPRLARRRRWPRTPPRGPRSSAPRAT